MDRNRTGSDAQKDQSIEQLIKEAYGLNARQLEKQMEWAMGTAESGSLLKGMPIPEAPENEFRIIMAKMAARGITPKVMADFDEETRRAMQREDYLDTTPILPHQRAEWEKTNRNPVADVKEYLELKKKRFRKVVRMAEAVAACALLVMAVILVPRIDAIAKKNYKYEARVESGEKGTIIWNNQENVIYNAGDLEEAYAKIKETLGDPILKLTFMPEGMVFSELEIKAGYARMEFAYAGNSVHMFEMLYRKDGAGAHKTDCQADIFVTNEWIEKEIPIQKNKLDKGKYEYCAYIEFNSAYYVLEGIMGEKDFVNLIKNLVLE